MKQKSKKKSLTFEHALKKAQSYCAYQERCQQEVRNKLYEWELKQHEVENIISDLITDNFLNEERFAKAYAGGKFRIKKWGREKIILELKKRKISDYCIARAMKEIEEDDYNTSLRKILFEKSKEIKEKNSIKKNYKLVQYALSKGYESELVWDCINKL